SCGARFKAENANKLFSGELKKLVPKPGMTEVYKVVLQEEFKAQTKAQREDLRQVKEALEKPMRSLQMPVNYYCQMKLSRQNIAAS
ncbi:hypothetical protein, partial [Pseudomonas aeruginosa]|uniref:hypothetical protein n=1 Tax=Pseudomonas aeruginosa TaxID=287 RepID=UPI002B4166AB